MPLQRDCVLPISRGGRYTLDNIAPACRSCNASKCNDEVTGWLRRKRLDERAFLERHVQIQALLAARFRATEIGSDQATGEHAPEHPVGTSVGSERTTAPAGRGHLGSDA